MDITLECVPTTIVQNENHSHCSLLGQVNTTASPSGLPSVSAGVSNTRLDLKIAEVHIPSDSWKEGLTLGKEERGQVAGLDWAKLVGKADPEQWRKLVMLIFPDRDENFFVNKDCNMKNYPSDPGYQACCVGEFGTKLAYRKVDGQYEWALTLPGTALRQMGTLGYCRLLVTLVNDFSEVRATRLDCYVENDDGRLKPEDIGQALYTKNYTGFRRFGIHYSSSDGDGLDGFTATLGSRESDSYWRCYHTRVKHDYDAIRLERELKGDKAHSVWFMLKTLLTRIQWTLRCYDHGNRQLAETEIGQFLAKIAVQGLDFIDRSEQYDNGSLEDCEPLPWWKAFKEAIGEIALVTARVKPSLQRSFDWLQRQVKKTLYKLKDGLGAPAFVAVIKDLCECPMKLDDRDDMEITILKDKGRPALAEKYDKKELANGGAYLKWEKEWMEGLKVLGTSINLTPEPEPMAV